MTPERRTTGEQAAERTEPGAARAEPSTPGLPAWESFAATDRQRLVRTVLDVAHRQLGTRPVGSRRELGR
ncbi:MAG TPA: hypothetical protein VM347_34405 [Nonomuraea sp.]|nr:hypothetical protein [Nonomuraea sp.]